MASHPLGLHAYPDSKLALRAKRHCLLGHADVTTPRYAVSYSHTTISELLLDEGTTLAQAITTLVDLANDPKTFPLGHESLELVVHVPVRLRGKGTGKLIGLTPVRYRIGRYNCPSDTRAAVREAGRIDPTNPVHQWALTGWVWASPEVQVIVGPTQTTAKSAPAMGADYEFHWMP